MFVGYIHTTGATAGLLLVRVSPRHGRSHGGEGDLCFMRTAGTARELVDAFRWYQGPVMSTVVAVVDVVVGDLLGLHHNDFSPSRR